MMKPKILVIGASGRVGSKVVSELDKQMANIRLVSSDIETVAQWQRDGRDAALCDLNKPATFAAALTDVKRVFLLTGYSADMLFQSKQFVDSAKDAGVQHIVHLGVFTSRRDNIPHFVWHDMIESYIEASGMAWTHLHPNVIADSILDIEPSIKDSGEFNVFWGDALQGWVFAEDIAAVAATVLSEGPDKHASAEYWMSTEVLSGKEVAAILSEVTGKQITCHTNPSVYLQSAIADIKNTSAKAYMESAVITMQHAEAGEMVAQVTVRDDLPKVVGRSGTTIYEWAKRNLAN